MEGESARRGSSSSSKNSKVRRGWNWDEEQALVNGLKDLVSSGWKSDNGFRSRYLAILEATITEKFPGTDLKATPHINSKIHVWKRQFGCLQSMLNKSGFGYNEKTCTIEVDNDVWEQYIKVNVPYLPTTHIILIWACKFVWLFISLQCVPLYSQTQMQKTCILRHGHYTMIGA